MIDRQTVQNLSIKYQTNELNTVREYCQHLFLSHFYLSNPSIYFKGGTALRLVFKSARFSEDLDFSTSMISLRLLEDVLAETAANIEKEGVGVNIGESKAITGGYLAVLHFSIYEFDIRVSLQISMRKSNRIKSEVVLITGDYVPDYTLQILNRKELINEKLKACIERSKPRDFYDVYFLLRSGLLSRSQREQLRRVKDKLKNSDINFSKELKEFLPLNLHPVIKNFRKTLNKELEKYE